MKRNNVFDFTIKNKEQKKEAELAENLLLIADEIYRVRVIRKISQESLARKADTTQAVISRIENGETNVGFDLLFKISKALKIKFSFGGFCSIPEIKNKKVFTYSTARNNLEEKPVKTFYDNYSESYDCQAVESACY